MPTRLPSPRTASHLLALATTLAILQSHPLRASATDNWIATDGNWSTPANWSTTTTVPGAFDTVNITPTDGANRTITYDYTGPAVTPIANLTINLTNATTPGNTTLFSMAANNLTASSETIGSSTPNGTGAFSQSGGNNTVPGNLYLGYASATTGSYALSGNAIPSPPPPNTSDTSVTVRSPRLAG